MVHGTQKSLCEVSIVAITQWQLLRITGTKQASQFMWAHSIPQILREGRARPSLMQGNVGKLEPLSPLF